MNSLHSSLADPIPILETLSGLPRLEGGRVGPLGNRCEDRWLVVRAEQSRHPEAGNIATRRCQPGRPALDELILLARLHLPPARSPVRSIHRRLLPKVSSTARSRHYLRPPRDLADEVGRRIVASMSSAGGLGLIIATFT